MKTDSLFPQLKGYVDSLNIGEGSIDDKRKQLLSPVINYLRSSIEQNREPQLLFVCTQNSRRSMFTQVWAQLAGWLFGVKNFHAYSAGGDLSALHPNTKDALIRTGIKIQTLTEGKNPLYHAIFSETFPPIYLFSKQVDFSENPKKNFGAVLVCVDDAEWCPFIPNADVRIPLPYSDPKKFDDTDEMEAAYDRCCRQIAAEMFWVMKSVSENQP